MRNAGEGMQEKDASAVPNPFDTDIAAAIAAHQRQPSGRPHRLDGQWAAAPTAGRKRSRLAIAYLRARPGVVVSVPELAAAVGVAPNRLHQVMAAHQAARAAERVEISSRRSGYRLK